MHDHACTGNDFFKCDFCRMPWSEDRPMVEGHQGSLICSNCLTLAYVELLPSGAAVAANVKCAMCLETRADRCWESPLFPGVFACTRCVRQAATTLERDPDSGWKKPAAAKDQPAD